MMLKDVKWHHYSSHWSKHRLNHRLTLYKAINENTRQSIGEYWLGDESDTSKSRAVDTIEAQCLIHHYMETANG